MGDRVKESLFSILGDPAPDTRVLDLFAGTGSLALEALSRGAQTAVLVERNHRAAEIARENAENARLLDLTRFLQIPAARALSMLEREGVSFRWIFVDPPYATNDLLQILERLGQSSLVAPDGIVVTHFPFKRPPAERYGALGVMDRRKYGQAEVRLYARIV